MADLLMPWHISWRADPRAVAIADRHYNRQAIGAPQFVPPGRCLVLLSAHADALWVTSWRSRQRVGRGGGGGEIPALGMVTFVDASKVRRKRDPGRCFVRAGFRHCGETQGGLLAFQLVPAAMPEVEAPNGGQFQLLASA